MQIKFSIKGECPVVSLIGDLDEHTANFVRLNLDTLLAEFSSKGFLKVMLDLSKLEFMDSTGIGVLIGRYKKFCKGNFLLCIKSPQQHVDRVLKLSGIYRLLPMVF